MKQVVTDAIVLSRTDYQEADRILTLLTPDHGKLSVIAKGVRRAKSKLAGGIELLAVNEITYIDGRSDIKTLRSARMRQYYDKIVTQLPRTMLAYDLLKRIHRVTEDDTEPEYYHILQASLAGLNNLGCDPDRTEAWSIVHLLMISGHTPNLRTDAAGEPLVAGQRYNYDFDASLFVPHDAGAFGADHLKLLRLAYASQSPQALCQVAGADVALADIAQHLRQVLQYTLRV
ncbi:DNA repair protein RecO [Candidatus Saccharibacteria bacterium]|nr:MAG: DNA repair protein RecO [Candidatus Saccharibacteria bacterium]